MPALTTPDQFDYIVGEIAVEAEISFHWDPNKLLLLNGLDLLSFDLDTGNGAFDLYAPDGQLILQFQALMVTDPTTEILFTGEGSYELFNCDPNIPGCGVTVTYDHLNLVSHLATPNTAFVTVVPEPATLLLLGSGLLVGVAFRKRFK